MSHTWFPTLNLRTEEAFQMRGETSSNKDTSPVAFYLTHRDQFLPWELNPCLQIYIYQIFYTINTLTTLIFKTFYFSYQTQVKTEEILIFIPCI